MTVECANCKSQNPDGKRFCGDCGQPLDAALAASPWLRDRIDEILKKHYKDQKIVEIETAQAIASRLFDWAKLLGFFVGIPVAGVLVILGMFGISTYSDFKTKVGTAKTDFVKSLTDAQSTVAELNAKSKSTAADLEKARAQVQDITDLTAKLNAVAKNVEAINEKLGFTPTSKVSVETKSKLKAAYGKFEEYLKSLGYQDTAKIVNVDIRENLEATGMLALYDPSSQTLVIDSKYAAEETLLYHEYMHHVLNPRNLPNAEMPLTYYTIETALSWYFTCSFVNNPKPAREATSWDLTSRRKFKELKPTLEDAVVNGTEIWGSAFWELRQSLGQQIADKILFDAWFKLQPEDVKSDKGASFVRILMDLDKTHQAQIRAVFTQRGLTL